MVFVWFAGKCFLVACTILFSIIPGKYDSENHNGSRARYGLEWPRGPEYAMASRFATWDGGLYLHIARHGYASGSPLCAFYPLLPAAFSPVIQTGDGPLSFWLCLLLVNGLSLWAIIEVNKWGSEMFGEQASFRAVCLFLALPGALFLSFPYTEAVFVLLSAVLLRGLRNKASLAVIVAALFLPLSRPVGVFACAPLVVTAFQGDDTTRRVALRGLGALAMGFGIYLVIMLAFTADPLEGFKAQRHFLNSPSITRLLSPLSVFSAFSDVRGICDPQGGLLDRLMFVIFIFLIVPLLRADLVAGSLVLLLGLVPAMTNLFLSYTRFFLCAYPLLWAFTASSPRLGRGTFACIVAVSGIVQGYCIFRHTSFLWVG